MNELEIFKAGRHVAMDGTARSFTESDLDQIIRDYDPKLHEAPIVVGHPSTNAPAYGWIKGLSRAGSVLGAAPTQVDPAFAEAVRAGRFKKVSSSFYLPDSPANPKPGGYYLRHVGFLGAQPPAVKGLRPANFAAAEEGVISFAEIDAPSFIAKLRALLVETLGEEATAEALAAAAAGETPDPAATPPSSPAMPADLAERRQRTTSLERRMSAMEHSIAERERKLRERENVSFLEELVRGGRPLPCKPAILLPLMELIDTAPAASVSFGENERRTPGEIFRAEVLGKLPKRVEFRELGGPGDETEEASDARSVGERARAYIAEQRAKGVIVDPGDAVRHVKRQR